MSNLLEKILNKKEQVFNKYGQNVNIDSIMIQQKGVVDCHFYKPDSLHEMRSISKVLIALAYGIAIDKKLLTVEDYVYPVIKNVANITNKDNIAKIKAWQVKHLLTYTCGYENQMFSERFIKDISPTTYVDYVINFDIVNNPGQKYVYNNADIFLLSVYFQELVGINIKDFIANKIFAPLDIKDYIWNNYDKYCPGGTGLYISHKDMFKIAQLLLNKGKYNNKQIVSADYVVTMCSTRLETPYAIKPERVLPKVGVGYVMHISRDGYFFKDGSNGQYIIVNFEKDIIITILSSESDMSCVTEILRNLI